jgi:hypothetical protein
MVQNPSDQESRRDFATSARRVAQALWMTGNPAEAKERQVLQQLGEDDVWVWGWRRFGVVVVTYY